MASISTSSASASMIASAMTAAGGAIARSGQKRRPVDPEETGFVPPGDYGRPGAKRARTIDDVLGSLTLSASDPPGNYFGFKRKNDNGGRAEAEGPAAKVARSSSGGRRMDPEGRKGVSPTNVASEIVGRNTSCKQQSFQRRPNECHTQLNPGIDEDDNDGGVSERMAVDDNDQESDSSVSEGSIRNAMYQLVFGRRNPPLPPNVSAGGDCGRYDAVDSKIEDIIRRSRLAAVIRSKMNEKRETAAADMEMDDDIGWGDADGDEDGEEKWIPGHG